MTETKTEYKAHYVDLVILKNKRVAENRVCYAPFCSDIRKGDKVKVEDSDCEYEIVDVFQTFTDTDLYRFATAITGGLQRVTGKIKPLDYSDEDYIKGIE